MKPGRDFVVIDKAPSSQLPSVTAGCVYLHETCGLPDAALRVQRHTTLVLPYGDGGNLDHLYHVKIWGIHKPFERNSVSSLVEGDDRESVVTPTMRDIWDMNRALDWLRARYEFMLMVGNVDRDMVRKCLTDDDKVISTIPLWVLFPDVELKSALAYSHQQLVGDSSQSYTMYNVDPSTYWYRISSTFGRLSIEYTTSTQPEKVAKFRKVVTYPGVDDLARTLDDGTGRLLLVGRWGRWQRGYLSHQSYSDVLRWSL